MIKAAEKQAAPPLSKRERRRRRRRRHLRVLVWTIGILVIARIALPYVVLYFANKKLSSMEGYYGHIDDIDIALFDGSYSIKRLNLKKIDKKDTIDFVYARKIDLAIEWRPIWHGDLVGKVAIDSSILVYTVDKNDYRDLAKDTANFRDVANAFMPLTLNKLEATNCTVIYSNPKVGKKLDIKLTDIHVIALNLVNAYDSTSLLPATIDGTANIYKGEAELHMKIDPFSDESKFDMNASLKHVNIIELNPLLQTYVNFDVESGNFEAFTEFAAKDGRINGYVKPIIKNLKIVTWKKREGNFRQKLWESIVAGAAWLVTNHKTHQIATKVYIKGDLKDPRISIGRAVIILFQNAFVAALKPYIDGEISINSVMNSDKETIIDRFIDKRKEKKAKREQKRRRKRD